MFNSRSDVIFTPQKLYLDWFGGIYTPIYPRGYTPLVRTPVHYSPAISYVWRSNDYSAGWSLIADTYFCVSSALVFVGWNLCYKHTRRHRFNQQTTDHTQCELSYKLYYIIHITAWLTSAFAQCIFLDQELLIPYRYSIVLFFFLWGRCSKKA